MNIVESIESNLSVEYCTIIKGATGSGKTYLMNQIRDIAIQNHQVVEFIREDASWYHLDLSILVDKKEVDLLIIEDITTIPGKTLKDILADIHQLQRTQAVKVIVGVTLKQDINVPIVSYLDPFYFNPGESNQMVFVEKPGKDINIDVQLCGRLPVDRAVFTTTTNHNNSCDE